MKRIEVGRSGVLRRVLAAFWVASWMVPAFTGLGDQVEREPSERDLRETTRIFERLHGFDQLMEIPWDSLASNGEHFERTPAEAARSNAMRCGAFRSQTSAAVVRRPATEMPCGEGEAQVSAGSMKAKHPRVRADKVRRQRARPERARQSLRLSRQSLEQLVRLVDDDAEMLLVQAAGKGKRSGEEWKILLKVDSGVGWLIVGDDGRVSDMKWLEQRGRGCRHGVTKDVRGRRRDFRGAKPGEAHEGAEEHD